MMAGPGGGRRKGLWHPAQGRGGRKALALAFVMIFITALVMDTLRPQGALGGKKQTSPGRIYLPLYWYWGDSVKCDSLR